MPEIIMILMLLISFMIIILLMLIQLVLSSNSSISDPQITSIESGFEMLKHGIYFSSSFFLLAVLFVLFDMELILLFPFILSTLKMLSFHVMMSFLITLLVISITLMLEWMQHGLAWKS